MKRSKKIALLVAAVLIVGGLIIGGAGLVTMGFDFTDMNTQQFTTVTHPVDAPFSGVAIDSAECDVRLLPSADDTCRVECCDSDRITHTVAVTNDTLTITRQDTRRWYEHIGVYWGREAVITVYLPLRTLDTLTVRTLSGDVTVSDAFSCRTADIQTASGDVDMAAAVSERLSIRSVSGDLHAKNASPAALEVKTTSGDISLSAVHGDTLTVKTTSGELTLEGAVVTGDMLLESTSGDVRLADCDAGALHIRTVSGDVSGNLLTEKRFDTHTTSGDVRVPSTDDGGVCAVTTVSGDIHFNIYFTPE